MRRALIALTVMILAGALPAAGQPPDFSQVRVLAVAPFFDDDPLHRRLAELGAARLSELLRGGRFQIIDSSRVAAEMQRQGIAAVHLISPARASAVAVSLGADAVLTGRLTEVFYEMNRTRVDGTIGGFQEGRVAVDVRVLAARTRLKLFEEEVFCRVSALVEVAMECVARNLAARLNALAPARN